MVYENVKELCKEKGISISALEREAGLGNGVIAGWKTASPNLNSLQAVAKALGVGINKLIEAGTPA